MSLSVTTTLRITALFPPSPPPLMNLPPLALHLGGTLHDQRVDFAPSSTSSRRAGLQQTNLISCSAALQMAPGS